MQYFASDLGVSLAKIQLRLTLISQHFENRWPALFGNTDMLAVHLDDMHLQRLDLEASLVTATWTGEPHRV